MERTHGAFCSQFARAEPRGGNSSIPGQRERDFVDRPQAARSERRRKTPKGRGGGRPFFHPKGGACAGHKPEGNRSFTRNSSHGRADWDDRPQLALRAKPFVPSGSRWLAHRLRGKRRKLASRPSKNSSWADSSHEKLEWKIRSRKK